VHEWLGFFALAFDPDALGFGLGAEPGLLGLGLGLGLGLELLEPFA
jgi:hypothetical protein